MRKFADFITCFKWLIGRWLALDPFKDMANVEDCDGYKLLVKLSEAKLETLIELLTVECLTAGMWQHTELVHHLAAELKVNEQLLVEQGQSDGDRNVVEAQTAKETKKIDGQLDRLTVAYLDAGAFSADEFRKRKQILLGQKRTLLDKTAALKQADELRFEPVIRFINGSKQMKYVASRHEPKELRANLEKVGSNLTLFNRELKWEPRGAWKLVVNTGRFARPVTTAPASGAVLVGESDQHFRQVSGKWSHGESNPDLLNAIQPSSLGNTERKRTKGMGFMCAQSGKPVSKPTFKAKETTTLDPDLLVVMDVWPLLSNVVRAAVAAMVTAAAQKG